MSESRQRWRLVFRRDEIAKYLSHLDAVHAWERALRRGRIPVAMSEGFNPRPKLAFAAPLQLGMLAEHELADLFLAERLTAPDLRDRLAACLPRGYVPTELFDVWTGEANLAPQLAAADYRLTLVGVGAGELAGAVERLLAATSLSRERQREGRTTRYDLRPLVIDLRIRTPQATPDVASRVLPDGAEPAPGLWMRLRHSQDAGTGRAEEVVAALADDLGLRLGWNDADESESPTAAPDAAVEPNARAIEVVEPVRERLWLASELK
jgi:radical SAM-linked protein